MIKTDGESYKHAVAKQLVQDWLREAAAKNDFFETFGAMMWRSNRWPPEYGVWVEYPYSDEHNCFDELGEFDSELEEMLPWWAKLLGEDPKRAPTPEEFQKLTGDWPKVIFDVGVQHKGRVGHGIEIVHRCPVRPIKLHYCAMWGVKLWVLDAEKIMRRMSPPSCLSEVAAPGGVP